MNWNPIWLRSIFFLIFLSRLLLLYSGRIMNAVWCEAENCVLERSTYTPNIVRCARNETETERTITHIHVWGPCATTVSSASVHLIPIVWLLRFTAEKTQFNKIWGLENWDFEELKAFLLGTNSKFSLIKENSL